jgi:putative peptide zinc metalloprotease protein
VVIAQANPDGAIMADLVISGIQEKAKTKQWLALREDLALIQGPRAYDGSPTWTLYDPAVHRYYRIGWLEFECLQRWNTGNAEQIASSIQKETPLDVEVADIEQFTDFLGKHQLAKPLGKESSARFAYIRHVSKPGLWTWLLHNYLFMRVPLLKPDRYLQKALPLIDCFFQRSFMVMLLLSLCVAVALVAQRWSEFSHSFLYSFTPEGILATVGMMSLSKVIHELGHAFAASHFGCRVPAMGVALLLGMPVLWTDVTDAWRLPRRSDRLTIDAAGMVAELTLAVIATLLWTVLPDGPLRSGSYLLASSAWIITLGINLNPFMRFDGYYLLVDALDIPNLQDRSFALARWWLRENLFGFDMAPPEIWPKKRQQFLIIYAYSVWVYRLILFTGIAWVVYYFFFKALGLALFAVEIGWFVVRPIVKEISVWRELIVARGTPIRPRPAWLAPLLLLAFLFIPWQSHLFVPGLLRAEAEYTFYCVEAAQVQEILVKEGGTVKTNQILVKLTSPDLDYKVVAAQLKLDELTERLASQSLDLNLARNNPKDFEELQSTRAELAGLRSTKEKLTVRATFPGHVRDLSDVVFVGELLAKDEPLGIVESPTASVIGYVEEADLSKLQKGGVGRFYPEGGDLSPFPVKIVGIDGTGTRELKLEELASKYGGEIAVRPDKDQHPDKDPHLVPEQGIYRVVMQTENTTLTQASSVRGRLSLSTVAESIAARLVRLTVVAFVKESGW